MILQEELVPVAFIDCSSSKISCSQLNVESEIIYLPAGNATLRQGTEIHSLDYVEIASAILQLLPDAQLMQQRDIEVGSFSISIIHYYKKESIDNLIENFNEIYG